MRAGIATITAALILAACRGGTPDNKLLGKWTLAKGDCLMVAEEFAATTEASDTRATSSYPAGHESHAVTYNTVDPTEVWVIGSAGISNAVGYKFLNDDRIKIDNWTACEYTRQ